MAKYYIKHNDNGEAYALYEDKNIYKSIVGDDFAALLVNLLKVKNLKITADKGRDAIDIVSGNDNIIILNARDFILKEKESYFIKFLINNGLNVNKLLSRKETIYFGDNYRTERKKKIKKGLSITCSGIAVIFIASCIYGIGDAMVSSSEEKEDDLKKDNIKLIQRYNPNATQNPYNVYLPLGEEEITEEIYYNYIMATYYDLIKKAAETYGIDPLLYLKVIVHNKAVATNSILPDGRFGLAGLEMENLFKTGVAAYNFSAEAFELIGIDKDKLEIPEYQFNIGAMVFQQKLRLYNYNVLAALQSMGMKESDFALGLIGYGRMSYGDDIDVSGSKYLYYYNSILNNTQDIGWLNLFDANGYSFASDILSTYGDGSYVTLMRHNNDGTNEKLEYRVYGNTFVLNDSKEIKPSNKKAVN